MMDAGSIAQKLEEIAVLMDVKGDNPFRVRAYRKAAETLKSTTEDIAASVKAGTLTKLEGVGPGIAETIKEIVRSGKSKVLSDLKKIFPDDIFDLLKIQGLGPAKVRILINQLNIKSVEELRKACEEHRIQGTEGFGKKTEENILQGIDLLKRSKERHLYPEALASALEVVSFIKQLKGVRQCEYAGSLRRKRETIGDIDILVCADEKNRTSILNSVIDHIKSQKILARGETKLSLILENGIQCDIRIVKGKEYPFALQYFTGSKEHNIEIRSRANSKGLTLNEYGFSEIDKKKKGVKIPVCKDETSLYVSLGLEFIPPELREGNGEVAAAGKKLPKLVEEKDLRGAFHCHTTSSDGLNTIEEMSAQAKKLGWEFIGFADHSQSAAYAGGLSIQEVLAQIGHIDELNAGDRNFRRYKGVECDILPDGSLDYPDSLLEKLDYVVVSIHGKFKMTEAEATKRIITALKNPFAAILGHPTGRLLLEREGYPVDLREVIHAAADLGKSIEINAHPARLDLDWRWVRYAKEKGVPICINPDAHNIHGLQNLTYGVGIARKGWLEAKDVVNTWKADAIESFFKNHKR
jgi:DNA polymerase (family 10)